jgi:hypothetical protein
MKLDDLCEAFDVTRFPGILDQAHPDRDAVLDARSRVALAVVDDQFLLDCIAMELKRIKEDRFQGGLVPFLTIPGLGIRFAFGYWPPGVTSGPHEHTAWTITAVCRNQLEVLTFDRQESYRQNTLVPKNRFEAQAGKTGFIYEPCLHEPRNVSSDWSLSLHVISPRDGERPVDHPEPLLCLGVNSSLSTAIANYPYTRVMVARQRQRLVHQLARILASMDEPQVPDVLAQCFGLASSATRRLINRIAPRPVPIEEPDSHWVLARTHEDLVLTHRSDRGMVALDVETPNGALEEFVASDITREAIAFVSTRFIFDVRELPGNLSEEERVAIGESLEETGLFRRIQK